MMIKKETGIKRVVNATRYSLQGLLSAWQFEAAFRQECALALVLIPVAFYLDVEPWQRVAMVSVLVIVMVVELLNTAVEAVVDRVGYEHHELAGRAKDTGSAAVMVSLALAAYVWAEALWSLWRG
ncbi:diacylglycerol kinase [Thaumasiovibrio subtropicus]|uniref:diacylglycerol kinase n=1 Tax=Thaumasiovibrio subtropicus TaxID=1891207 RepID=UPI00192D1007|nr:diacylglycerol kinase [Thaumasiovibrio subtropicus]